MPVGSRNACLLLLPLSIVLAPNDALADQWRHERRAAEQRLARSRVRAWLGLKRVLGVVGHLRVADPPPCHNRRAWLALRPAACRLSPRETRETALLAGSPRRAYRLVGRVTTAVLEAHGGRCVRLTIFDQSPFRTG